jgi:hypothetical protein
MVAITKYSNLPSRSGSITAYKILEYSCNTINSMDQSPSWEANSHSARQENLCLLQNPEFHYHVHKSHHLSLSWIRCIH